MKRTIVIRDAPAAAPRRWVKLRPAITLVCALTADGLQWLFPFLWPVCDGAMVIAVLLLWGWRWEVLVAVIPELIPGLALAPTWTIFAGYLILARGGNIPDDRNSPPPSSPSRKTLSGNKAVES